MVVLINILIIVLGFLRPLRTLGHALFDFLGQLDDVNGNIFRENPRFIRRIIEKWLKIKECSERRRCAGMHLWIPFVFALEEKMSVQNRICSLLNAQ